MKSRIFAGLMVGFVLLGILAGCAPAAASNITVESVWGKPSPMYPTAGAFFMLIKNNGATAEKLVSGTSPACGSIELHEVVMKDDGSMGMNLLENPIDIPAGGQVELKAGDLHAMCIMKNDNFAVGTKVDLTLKFENAGEKTVTAEIRGE